MFALAIYNIKTRLLTLCRDHAGIKPLFFYYDETSFIFASELKSIKSIKGAQLDINKASVPYFLHLGFIPHPLTIYKNVEKFPAAHYLQFDTTRPGFETISSDITPFWKLETRLEKKSLKNEAVAKETLTTLLFDAVEKQLVSDVPIGTFLSGGIDSSLVTAIASKV